jgi:hypothetical protein
MKQLNFWTKTLFYEDRNLVVEVYFELYVS